MNKNSTKYKKMKLTIERITILDRLQFTIDVEKDNKISDVKTIIYLTTKIPFSYQQLWYNGVQLDNQKTLEYFGILMDSKITMDIKINRH